MAQQINNLQDLNQYISSVEERIKKLEAENNVLRDAVAANDPKALGNTMSLPQTNILSRSFLARAFAVWGHYFVAQLIISTIVGGCLFVFYFASIMSLLSNVKQSVP